MKAITYEITGAPDVLRLSDQPVPEPGNGEVRVAIHRAGVNPTDLKSRAGNEPGTPVDPPQTPGQDGAGVVDAVGQGVDAGLVGARVWVWEAAWQRRTGTAAEYTTVPVRQAVELPDGVSFDVGASLGIPFLTAHRCLTVSEHGPRRLGPGALQGHTVLVTGGAGAVGNAAIQLARWSDARVIATVSSPEKAQLAAAAGADDVINYQQQDVVFETKKIVPSGVDLIVDVAAATNAPMTPQLLAPNGTLTVYATDAGDDLTLPIRALMTTNARVQFVLVYNVAGDAKHHAVEDLSRALGEGEIRMGAEVGLPVHHFSLERAAEAHAALENGAIGKVLIDVH
jgi:NADPH2:quinone reductase